MSEKQTELQREVVDKMLPFFNSNRLGHLNLAMRFGKTKTVIDFLKIRYGRTEPIILIAYPDNKLKDVWIQELENWNYHNSLILFCNFSSLKKHIDLFYDFFIIDEWHSLSENELKLCKQISDNSKYTLGLSGTVSKETQDSWPELKEIYKFTTDDGIKGGILSDYKITVHKVELDRTVMTPNKKGKLLTEAQKYRNYSSVIERMQREGKNTMFLALARNRLSLSSIGKLNYIKSLLKHLGDKRVVVFTGLTAVADSIGIPSYHNKSKTDINFQNFQNKKVNHLALAAMGKVGVTYSDLDSVILLNFVYNSAENAQILNRCIKLDYTGKVADMHLICLNEEPELKKIKESLSMLDKSKIKYV